MRRNLTAVVLAALVLAVGIPSISVAQGQAPVASESALLQRANQYPHEVSALLDLAKLYFEQHRYDDASRALARAQAVIQQEQLTTVGTPVPQPQAQTRWLLTGTAASQADWNKAYRVGADVKEPARIKFVEPVYPAVAKAAKITGYVVIEVLIGPDGHVEAANIVKPHPLLQDAALMAVQQWAYAPPMVNGAPASVVMSVTVQFSLK